MVSQKKWEILQTECKLVNSFHLQWCQLIYALPEFWEKSIDLSKNSNNILLGTDHHITRKSKMIAADKLTAIETRIKLISMANCKPSSLKYISIIYFKITCQATGIKYIFYHVR